VDPDGFGGHTPLFNAVVNGPRQDAAIARLLLERGADRDLRVNLRKFLDWRETPGWHVAANVTALEWGRGFPETNWVSTDAVELLSERETT
jgi:ankyrin repeat protein